MHASQEIWPGVYNKSISEGFEVRDVGARCGFVQKLPLDLRGRGIGRAIIEGGGFLGSRPEDVSLKHVDVWQQPESKQEYSNRPLDSGNGYLM
jgi:hypothetical protein